MTFKFPLTVESLEDVPAEFQALYVTTTEGEGDDAKTSVTLIPDLKALIEVRTGAVSALDKERKRANAAEKALKDWKAKAGVDTPEALEGRLSELQTAVEAANSGGTGGSDDKDVAKRIEAAKEEAARKANKEIERLQGQLAQANENVTRMRKSLDKHMREEAATRAISTAKGNVTLLKPHVMSQLKLEEEGDDYVLRVIDHDGEARYDGDGKPMSPETFVGSLRGIEHFAAAFEPDGASGGGARSTKTAGVRPGTKNPWVKETRNLTEQMRITRENPQLANVLKQQAGVASK